MMSDPPSTRTNQQGVQLYAPIAEEMRERYGWVFSLDDEFHPHSVLVEVAIHDSSQVTRVAETLARVDSAVRRGTAAFYPRDSEILALRAVSPTTGGLFFERVDIASYH